MKGAPNRNTRSLANALPKVEFPVTESFSFLKRLAQFTLPFVLPHLRTGGWLWANASDLVDDHDELLSAFSAVSRSTEMGIPVNKP